MRISNSPGGLAGLFDAHAQSGWLVWIGVRPAREAPVQVLTEVAAAPGTGLSGDHYAGKTQRTREVTLLQAEHLPVVAAYLGRAVEPEALRRNLLVAGINLLTLRNQRFQIGTVVLEGTGLCHPCARMEKVLGHGGYNALRGHGGITARIVSGGALRVGDTVLPVAAEPTALALPGGYT